MKEIDMIAKVYFVDNDVKEFEIFNSADSLYYYDNESGCFTIESVEGRVIIPSDFIKCIIFA